MGINSDWFYGEFLEFWTFFFESFQSKILTFLTNFQWKGRQKCILICHRINWMWWFQRAKSSNWVILTPQMKKTSVCSLKNAFLKKKTSRFPFENCSPLKRGFSRVEITEKSDFNARGRKKKLTYSQSQTIIVCMTKRRWLHKETSEDLFRQP